MMSDLIRYNFEIYILKKWPQTCLRKIAEEDKSIYPIGNYIDPTVQICWETWQAAIQFIERSDKVGK